MNIDFENIYISCGCNKVPHIADWGRNGLICFGSCNSIAIYNPAFEGEGGKIIQTLHGHKERVNCVRWLQNNLCLPENHFVSASADGTAIIWGKKNENFKQEFVLRGHTNIVNVADGLIRKLPNASNQNDDFSMLIATSSIDSTVVLWEKQLNEDIQKLDVIKWSSGFCLDIKFTFLPNTEIVLIACAADDNKVHLFVEKQKSEIDNIDPNHRFIKVHILSGHDDWVRSLDFLNIDNVLYLATGSQDTFIRVYKFERRQEEKPTKHLELQNGDNQYEDILKPEEKIIKAGVTFNEYYFAITLETILSGHEGWVYGVSWQCPLPPFSVGQTTEITGVLKSQNLKLLSSSMDKSLIVWSPDKSGIWSEETRVGEVGGNMLGFYGGKFGPNGKYLMGHGYQGSFHIWAFDEINQNWQPKVVVGGHTAEVTDLAWDVKGNYILSVGLDQTTRLHAPWVRNGKKITWHEIARPQIHGYDLNCIAMLSEHKFASGADEKVIRAFTAPNNFIENFRRICGFKEDFSEFQNEKLPQGASVPALGLSNKPVFEQMKKEGYLIDDEYPDLYFSPIQLEKPPTEDNLLQNTLWPEVQKLYGHGYEIFSLAARNDGVILASSSKATSSEYAAIILWNAKTWLQIQKLFAHQLTVTQLSFSPNGKYLLSVSRDRKWSLFRVKEDGKLYELVAALDVKNNFHTRVIWCCAWTFDSTVFITGSRDGKIGFWAPDESNQNSDKVVVNSIASLELLKESITALAFAPLKKNDFYILAVGLENGNIFFYKHSNAIVEILKLVLQGGLGHDLTVKKLAFRPKLGRTGYHENRDSDDTDNIIQLASCSSDHFIKVYDLFLNNLYI